MTVGLDQALADYLSLRRALGFKLDRAQKLLAQFVGYLHDHGAETVSTDLALAWVMLPADAAPRWWQLRMSVVRGFAVYLHTLDAGVQVPPAGLIRCGPCRATPYLYSEADIAALVHAAGRLPRPLGALTYQTLIGLLAVTGIRVGEAIGLDREDFDSECDGLLIVRGAKFGKTRLIPLHPGTVTALRAYLQARDVLFPAPASPALLISTVGTRLHYNDVWRTFPAAGRADGPGRPLGVLPAQNSRSATQLRGAGPARWIHPRRRRAGPPAAAVDLSRPCRSETHLLVSVGRAGTVGPGPATPRHSLGGPAMSTLAPTLQAFFTDRLARQRQASSHTIAAYRDTCKLLLTFAEQRTGIAPSRLKIADLDAGLIGAFLDHLEHERSNTVRTRNARLAAVHSLFRFAALAHPQDAAVIQRVLAIPPKRFDQALITYLTDPETEALLAAPDQTTWTGRRDHALLVLAVHTGLRVSELISLTPTNIHLGTGAHVSCFGKGRKQRITPLTAAVTSVLRAWLAERAGLPSDPLFPTRRGTPLSPDAIQLRLTTHATTAARTCPTIAEKKISPHTLRHTAAMRLLAAGVDTTIIALWLGHETVATTQIYIHADLALKERALARTAPLGATPGRYQPPDTIIAFLEAL